MTSDNIDNMGYVSLHNHTTFSILDSLVKPVDLFKRAKELGQEAIAVTDHGTLSSMWDSLLAAKSTGVKLIPGCEFYFVDDLNDPDAKLRHIILLSKNQIGYKNLLLTESDGFDHFVIRFKKVIPRISWETLEKYKEGLICTTACANGILGQIINGKKFDEAFKQASRLKDIFGDNLAIELQAHGLKRISSAFSEEIDQQFTNNKLKEIAEKLNIRTIVTSDTHYLKQEQAKSHDVMLAISAGHPIESGSRLKYDVPELFLKPGEEVFKKLKRLTHDEEFAKKCIDNTKYFADQCEFPEWIDPRYTNPSGKELPEFPVKDQEDYNEFLNWKSAHPEYDKPEDQLYLRYKCENVLYSKYSGTDLEIYKERMNEELDVLGHCGVSSYMLMVADIVEWCKKNNIPVGPGRGCLAGDTKVLTENGFVDLKDIKLNDKVYTHTGKLQKVTDKFDYDVSEDGVEIKSLYSFGHLKLTKDHKIYARKDNKKAEWINAGNLNKGDFILSTAPRRKVKNRPSFDLSKFIYSKNTIYDENFIYINKCDSKTLSIRNIEKNTNLNFEEIRKFKNGTLKLDDSKIIELEKYLNSKNLSVGNWISLKNNKQSKISRKIIADDDFLYLLGRWVGDGSFHGKLSKKRGITISFNCDDEIGINKISAILNKLGLHSSISKAKNSNGLNLTVSNMEILNLFKFIFPNYKNSYNKSLPYLRCCLRSDDRTG